MRGAHIGVGLLVLIVGIIPAYAGSTRRRNVLQQKAGDHPRVCGEHNRVVAPGVASPGSSPRMRGAPVQIVHVAGIGGIIPAYAGSTWNSVLRTSVSKDHPRVCGEHDGNISGDTVMPGSSPRMRGALGLAHGVPVFQGIIPAYAGSTIGYQRIRSIAWDHPRVCGEHPPENTQRLMAEESSPRIRGAPRGGLQLPIGLGIIPAYAGSTRR